jgi:two-component system chemotaxis sensor kinase CheA
MNDSPPERSKKLKRQIKRHLNDENAESVIMRMAATLPDSPEAAILRGLSSFLSNIDNAYDEYEDKLKFSIRSLEVSSQEQNDLNKRLESLNASINAMLDSLGQGLVFFDQNGICSEVYSEAFLTLMGTSPSGKNIADILKLDDRQRQDFQSWLSVVFDDSTALNFEDLKSLAPSEFINNRDQYIALDYAQIRLIGDVKTGILLIATDKTLERESAGQLLEIRNEAKKILGIARRRNEFWRFIDNLQQFTRQIRETGFKNFDRNELMRGLHTNKGLSQLFGFTALADVLHATEGRVEQGWQQDDNEVYLYNQLDQIEQETVRALSVGRDLFGADFFSNGQVRSVDYQVLEEFRMMLGQLPQTAPEYQKIITFFDQQLLSMPVSECFAPFISEIGRIAETQGKPLPKINVVNGDLRIIMDDYEDFFDCLIHLARNLIDHGIEAPNRRRENGKPEFGTVTISANRAGSFYFFEISDDGRGFNVGNIRRRLTHMGEKDIEALSDEDVIQRIFNPAFSTLSITTNLSGRGVGLSAVKTVVEDLGGTVKASIAEDGGARFTFKLPCRE